MKDIEKGETTKTSGQKEETRYADRESLIKGAEQDDELKELKPKEGEEKASKRSGTL